MNSQSCEKRIAVVDPVRQTEESEEISSKKKAPESIDDSQNESDIDEESDEEIILDEPSDTENYLPPVKMAGDAADQSDDDDVSCSSGDEEDIAGVHEIKIGEEKLFKLRFTDVEAKQKELAEQERELSDDEEDCDDKEEVAEEEHNPPPETVQEEDKENIKPLRPFKDYRTTTIFDEDMENNYKSDEDDDFNPMHCEETWSDVEYVEGEDRDTESEPETELIEGTHKKTGEPLVCIKMIEQLQIPPNEACCSKEKLPEVSSSGGDHPMECL